MILIDRLSKLDAPDREVDVLIENELGLSQFKRVECGHGDSDYVRHNVQRYTASVDAAIALAARVLPGFNADLDIGSPINGEGLFWCRLWRDYSEPQNYSGEAFNPATAICIALLRAKEASKP